MMETNHFKGKTRLWGIRKVEFRLADVHVNYLYIFLSSTTYETDQRKVKFSKEIATDYHMETEFILCTRLVYCSFKITEKCVV